jgi:hypothetical protein
LERLRDAGMDSLPVGGVLHHKSQRPRFLQLQIRESVAEDRSGASEFFNDADGQIFHTYSTSGGDALRSPAGFFRGPHWRSCRSASHAWPHAWQFGRDSDFHLQ